MKRRYRNSLLSRTCLLQATLFALFGHLPSTHGLTCYCSDEPSIGLPVCHWDNYMCSGDVCYVRRFLKNDVIYTKWGCLSYSNPMHHIDLICDDGAFNGATDHYACCTDRNNCNQHIEVVLPIERPPATSVPTVATTNDGLSSGNGSEGPSDPPATSSETVTKDPTTTHLPSPTTVLQQSLVGNIASSKSLPAVTSLPPISRPTSTPSPNPTGSPQLKCYCPTCPSLEVTCGPSSSCFVHKDYNLGEGEAADAPFSLSWGCLNRSESAKKCHGQSKEYECCSHKDYCNMQLHKDDSADCNSVSGGCQANQLRDEYLVAMIVVVIVAFIMIVGVLVGIAVLLRKIRWLQRNSVKGKSTGSNSSANSVTTESESLSSPTSTSSTHHYLHISSLPGDEPAFGDSFKCSGCKA